MDPTNAELYKLAITDAPYVVAAYAVIWVALVVYVTMVLRRIMKLEQQVVLLEDESARRAKTAE
jgi:CcmD family protein